MTNELRWAAGYLAHHRTVIAHALRNEAMSAGDDEWTVRRIAAALWDGARVPLFASGEAGARAAEGLAERHRGRRVAAEMALAALEELEEER